MPRTTTCRSEPTHAWWVLLVALVVGMVPTAGAQEQARPATHTVRRGDTLWDLARRYLGDPFLWPQIYRLNTDVVEDPHWIYPGEVLRLVAGADTRAVPEQGAPAPAPAAAPVEPPAGQEGEPLFPRRRQVEVTSALEDNRNRAYRALRPGEFHSSGFMTEGQALPLGELRGNVTPSQIQTASERSFTLYNDHVGVRPPSGASYRVGDSLLVVELGMGRSGNNDWGDIVRPTGLLVVTAQGRDQMVARVAAIYGEIRSGQHVLPAERFVPGTDARVQRVTNGVTARVIIAREDHPMRHPQDVLFIDRGRQGGVARGDIFEVIQEPGVSPRDRTTDEVMAVVQVVHVRDRTATVRILTVSSPNFGPGALVRQVGRLPN